MLDRNYIDAFGTVRDVNSLVSEKMSGGTMLLMYTDKFLCDTLKFIEDTEHLLEARIFTETAELKIMRPSMNEEFTYRFIDDSLPAEKDCIDEIHYLDIDSKRSSGSNYTATGGGKYSLPVENAEKIQIRNYISYDSQGIAQITDFRAVRFIGRGEQ